MGDDGTMSRVRSLLNFARTQPEDAHVATSFATRMQHERYVRRVAEAVLPTRFGVSA